MYEVTYHCACVTHSKAILKPVQSGIWTPWTSGYRSTWTSARTSLPPRFYTYPFIHKKKHSVRLFFLIGLDNKWVVIINCLHKILLPTQSQQTRIRRTQLYTKLRIKGKSIYCYCTYLISAFCKRRAMNFALRYPNQIFSCGLLILQLVLKVRSLQ